MSLVGSGSVSSTSFPDKPLSVCLEEMALDRHRHSLHQGRIRVDHLRSHSVGYAPFFLYLFLGFIIVVNRHSV